MEVSSSAGSLVSVRLGAPALDSMIGASGMTTGSFKIAADMQLTTSPVARPAIGAAVACMYGLTAKAPPAIELSELCAGGLMNCCPVVPDPNADVLPKGAIGDGAAC